MTLTCVFDCAPMGGGSCGRRRWSSFTGNGPPLVDMIRVPARNNSHEMLLLCARAGDRSFGQTLFTTATYRSSAHIGSLSRLANLAMEADGFSRADRHRKRETGDMTTLGGT